MWDGKARAREGFSTQPAVHMVGRENSLMRRGGANHPRGPSTPTRSPSQAQGRSWSVRKTGVKRSGDRQKLYHRSTRIGKEQIFTTVTRRHRGNWGKENYQTQPGPLPHHAKIARAGDPALCHKSIEDENSFSKSICSWALVCQDVLSRKLGIGLKVY
jgi:hypothetical protein